MKPTTLKQKLVCPYCNSKQEYKGKAYFAPNSTLSHGIRCDVCDECFNAQIVEDNRVVTFSNLLNRFEDGLEVELKGCPFCGISPRTAGDEVYYIIFCQKCDVKLHKYREDGVSAKTLVEEAWNTRCYNG